VSKKKRRRKEKRSFSRDGLRLRDMSEVRTRSKQQAAVRYARLGFPVLPVARALPEGTCSCGNSECPRPGKHALMRTSEATTDHRKVFRGWQRYPDTNIGVPVGFAHKHFVLDLDTPDREQAMVLLSDLRATYGIGRPAAIALSAGRNPDGSGLHLHYRAPVGAQLGTLLEAETDLLYDPELSAGVPTGELAGGVGIQGDVGPEHPHIQMYATLPPSTNAGVYRWLDLEEVWGA
jgi:hypothetical protein